MTASATRASHCCIRALSGSAIAHRVSHVGGPDAPPSFDGTNWRRVPSFAPSDSTAGAQAQVSTVASEIQTQVSTVASEIAPPPSFEFLYREFPFSIQPETVCDYPLFERSLAEAIAEDLGRGVEAGNTAPLKVEACSISETACSLRIAEAAKSFQCVKRALERVEQRRAKGENVGLATSLYLTRDLPGSAAASLAAAGEESAGSWNSYTP